MQVNKNKRRQGEYSYMKHVVIVVLDNAMKNWQNLLKINRNTSIKTSVKNFEKDQVKRGEN